MFGLPLSWVFALFALIVVFFGTALPLLRRYKRCPPDKIMVVYGKIGSGPEGRRSAKCLHGGAAFVFPIFQDYQFLDLIPITMDIDLRGALSQQNIRINVPSTFTVGISTQTGIMENAAERLLGIPMNGIKQIAEDIIFGQARVVIATMSIEEIICNRDKFVDNITQGVEVELRKIGLKLINVNVKDIIDESGYIEALGKEAAARAINEAKKAVAEKTRDGEIGKAVAERDQRIQVAAANATAVDGENTAKISVANSNARAENEGKKLVAERHREGEIGKAEAEKEQRIQVAAANATAVDGENKAKIDVANSNANRREKEAEAERKGTAAEKVRSAMALEEAYQAEQRAEMQRAERERATRTANIVVPTEIEKAKITIEAEAAAERIRRVAKGEADAIYVKLEAEARGNRELLVKQAEGLSAIVAAADGKPNMAALLMITEKLPEIVHMQVEAVKNLKIDKVTVWDSMGADGTPSTAKYLSGLLKSLPPLQSIFEMAGMTLPSMLDVKGEGEERAGAHPSAHAAPRPAKPEEPLRKPKPAVDDLLGPEGKK
jgi:flotillin